MADRSMRDRLKKVATPAKLFPELECVNRKDAILRMRSVASVIGFETPADAIDAVVTVLKRMPSEDVAPVVHGRWGNYEPFTDGYRCSHCKLTHRTCTNYCPSCGAKMEA